MSTSNLQTPFGNLPLQERFTISSVFSTGLAEFDQNVIFLPFKNANSLFELDDKDINLEIFLNKPDSADFIKEKIQKNIYKSLCLFVDRSKQIFLWSAKSWKKCYVYNFNSYNNCSSL